MDASALDKDRDTLRIALMMHMPHSLLAEPSAALDRLCAELAALRARVEDLELMLHAEWRGERRWFRRSEDGAWILGRESTGWDLRGEPVCPDDGTGLPLLTAEARRALRGEP